VALTNMSSEGKPLLEVLVLPGAHMTWPRDYLPLSGKRCPPDRDPTKLLCAADSTEESAALEARMERVHPPLEPGDAVFFSSYTMTALRPVHDETLRVDQRGVCVALSPLLVPVGPEGQCQVSNSPEEVQAAACQDRLPAVDTFSGAVRFESDSCRQAPRLVPTEPPQFFGWGRYLSGVSVFWVLCRC
jgi:hypothetical protein